MDTVHSFGLPHLLASSGWAVLGVVAMLIAMSCATWYFIAMKLRQLRRMRHSSAARFHERFWEASSLQAVARDIEAQAERDPFARLACDGLYADAHYRMFASASADEAAQRSEFITRALRASIGRATARLESGLTFLASTSSTAPFIGLFGTVWGIYHALVGIGAAGQTTLEAVAGPVGEALIVTALGLAVAIPAALAYNFFVRRNRLLLSELDAFAHDLHALFVLGVPMAGCDVTASPAVKRRASRELAEAS